MKIVLRISLCLSLLAGLCRGQPFGLSNRVANTTLAMPANPPSLGYVTSNAFPGVTNSSPICLATPPGETNRLFILERVGRVTVITNLAAPTRHVFMDISSRVTTGGEEGLLGIAFHPNYAINRYFYLFYSLTTNTGAGSARHQRISRFERSASNANQGLTNSELALITQQDDYSNHNGGDIHFGADGYLYVSLGDEGDQNDAGNNSQRIDKDFFSGILRIDVDKLPANLPPKPHAALMNVTNYFIPADNPWVGATQFNGLAITTNALRAEFWAVGLRNPWRMSFDQLTGVLYCGDVGGSLREEINVIVRGGNYGWAYREGTINGPKSAQAPGGFNSVRPILEYSHGTATNQGNSVTGGVLYRGSGIPALTGRYVFADYDRGHFWALTPNGTNTVPFQYLTTEAGIVAFGTDPRNGDVLMAAMTSGQIRRLVYVPTNNISLPATLAGTGAFASLAALTPQPGIVPYDINVPFWSDNATKSRWFSIPHTNLITFRATNVWSFPTGAVWIKHFELELTNGVPASRRRLETRFIVRRSAGGVYGVTYRWDNAQTNATLVPDTGLDESFVINDGGILRTQVWHYPSWGECLQCHTVGGGYALGFNTLQLHRDFMYPNGVTDNQIRALNNVGYFTSSVTNLNALRALAPTTSESHSVEYRVRSYLAANCLQCHAPGGTVPAGFDSRIFTPLSAANLVDGPLNNNLGNTNNRAVVRGSLEHSMLLTRITTNGVLRMPPLDSTLNDTQAIALVSRWITNDLVGYQTFAQWQIANFGATNSPPAAAAADPDADGAPNYLEWLTSTSPINAMEAWGIGIERSGSDVEVIYPRLANRGFEVQWNTDLFNPSSWQILNVPENRPFFSAIDEEARVPDSITNAPAKYYRVRVYEP